MQGPRLFPQLVSVFGSGGAALPGPGGHTRVGNLSQCPCVCPEHWEGTAGLAVGHRERSLRLRQSWAGL